MSIYAVLGLAVCEALIVFLVVFQLKGEWKISNGRPSYKLTLACSISNVLLQLKGPK